MGFKGDLENDLNSVFFNSDEFAHSAVFVNSSGDAGELCNVIIDHNALVQMDGYEAGVTTLGTTIEALYSVVGKPKKGAVFTVGSVSYTVRGIESCDGQTTRVRVTE